MSLMRVLIIILSLVFLLVMGGSFAIAVNNSREFLEEQLSSHAQDAATSLGLTLSTTLGIKDAPAIASLVDSVFDRGYYQEIIVRSTDNELAVERRLPLRVKGVPDWFTGLVTLETPRGEAAVMAGWRTAGRVTVRSHPGYAYAELWRNMSRISGWFLASWAMGTLLIVVTVRLVLSHLRDVENQAIAISERSFPVLKKMPWSREMGRVVTAMNHMSQKLKTIFQDQADFIEALRHESNNDPVTGLANRRHLENRLQFLIEDSEDFDQAAFLMVQVENFKQYNQQHGHLAGDELLQAVGAAIADTCRKDRPEHIVARLNGAEFAVLAVAADEAESERLAVKLLAALNLLHYKTDLKASLVFYCGIAGYTGCESISQLFSECDLALRSAQHRGTTGWYRSARQVCTPDNIYGAGRLRALLRQRLDDKAITLHLEPAFDIGGDGPIHHEVLARIKDEDGNILPAQLFIKLVEQMSCIPELDRLVIESVLARMGPNAEPEDCYAVNISPVSLMERSFTNWLVELLQARPQQAARLYFELPEPAFATFLEAVRPAIESVIAAGGRVALDHFGIGPKSFGYLIDLKLAYLKLDGSYIRQIEKNRDQQFFIQAIGNIAHGLDMQAIAVHVESRAEMDTLEALGVDAVQGRLLNGPP